MQDKNTALPCHSNTPKNSNGSPILPSISSGPLGDLEDRAVHPFDFPLTSWYCRLVLPYKISEVFQIKWLDHVRFYFSPHDQRASPGMFSKHHLACAFSFVPIAVKNRDYKFMNSLGL